MTIKDLYCYAQERGIENLEVEIQYADDGGYYYGTRDLNENEIIKETKEYGEVVII